MKYILVALLLTGCSVESIESTGTDQCMRNKLFQECLQALPTGPQSVMYNDWAEVVEACGNQAYYASLRKEVYIKAECKV